MVIEWPEDENFTELIELPDRLEGETITQWSLRVLDIDSLPFAEPHDDTFMFYGQETVMGQIEPFLTRDKAFPNTLILGMPGMGKTRLAKWIANARTEPFEKLLCPVQVDRVPHMGIVLLDESHRQAHPEYLFPIMEMDDVTVIGATTRPELLEPAFKSRFVLTLHLKRYSDDAMAEMAQSILPMKDETALVYAGASAGNPRQLELLMEFAKEIGREKPAKVLEVSRITGDGLTEYHLSLLRALRKAARPIGLSTMASMLYSDQQSVRDHEQLLVDLDLMELRSNGRTISRRGTQYLKAIEQ